MAVETKEKIVTLESLSKLHEHNNDTYLPINSPVVTGGLTLDGYENEGLNGTLNNDRGVVNIIDINENDNLRIGYGHYMANSGNTHLCGKDVVIWCGEIKNSYRPYYRVGDTVNFTGNKAVNVVGWTDSMGNVIFTIPITKPVIGEPYGLAIDNNGFILRQNGSGCAGSSPERYVKSKSCAVTHAYNTGFVLTASFESQDNIQVNSPIAVHWDGTIQLYEEE